MRKKNPYIVILSFIIVIMLSCSGTKELAVKHLKDELSNYTKATKYLETNRKVLWENPSLNPTGKAVLITNGSLNHLNLPLEIEKSFIGLFDKDKIETVSLEKFDLVRYKFANNNEGFFTWKTINLLYNPKHVDLEEVYNSQYQKIIKVQKTQFNNWFYLEVQKTID